MTTLFERQLEALHEQMLLMGSMCEKIISLSSGAIQNPSGKLAGKIFETDREIDAKEREIETLCIRLLLHQHPVACDLREVSAALKMISDMERVGDQCADIADLSLHIDHNGVQMPEEIAEMADYCVDMVTGSIRAFVDKDLELCRRVIDEDDLVDHAFNRVKEHLSRMACEPQSGGYGEVLLDTLMTAKYLERIGDHAVNIAEWVEFTITGEHRNNEHQR